MGLLFGCLAVFYNLLMAPVNFVVYWYMRAWWRYQDWKDKRK